MAKYDDMSFSKAFAAARKDKGAGKTFTWKGKRYTTNYKEEENKAPTKSKRPAPRNRDKMIAERARRAIEESEGRERGAPSRSRRPMARPDRDQPRMSEGLKFEKIESTKLPKQAKDAAKEAVEKGEVTEAAVVRKAEEVTNKRVPGRAIVRAFMNWLRGEGPTDPTKVEGMAKGGMVKNKKKYDAIGASRPPAQKSSKKK